MGEFALAIPEDLIEALVERVRTPMTAQPRFVSKQALAQRLGVNERTIKTWRTKGLPAAKVGKTLMFDVEIVDRWIEHHA